MRAVGRARTVAGLLGAVLLAAACGGGGGGNTQAAGADVLPGGKLGAPETKSISFGLRLPDCGSQSPIFIAQDKGYFKEEGLEVNTVITEQLGPGLLGGSLAFAVLQSTDGIVDPATKNVPERLIAAWRSNRSYYIAVRPEIKSAADLAGKQVILGAPGSGDLTARTTLLKQEGWDLSQVKNISYVFPPGGSDTWVQLLQQGKVAMAPIFERHRAPMQAAGMKLVVDKLIAWPNDSVGASQQFLASNPNTTVHFLRAIMKAMKVWLDPANKDYALGLCAKNGVKVTEDEKNTYEKGFLGQYGRTNMALRPQEFSDLISAINLLPQAPPFTSYADVRYLHAAQGSLGLPLDPKV